MDFEKNGHEKSWKSLGILNGRRCTNPDSHLTPFPSSENDVRLVCWMENSANLKATGNVQHSEHYSDHLLYRSVTTIFVS
jgi:hypothetical protein